MYKHIWIGNVDTKELENCNSNIRLNLQGPHRCCLTEKSIVFIRLNNSGGADLSRNNQSKMTLVEIGILSIRGCGHKDNIFHMEAGRSSGIGTGILRMELDDGTIAEHMHNTILHTMYASKDASRPRSYSSGSGSSRPSVRSRHYYNPPPSQVGMGKPPNTANTPTLHSSISKFQLPRTRCESLPVAQPYLTDEARYRTSSEGETTMKRPFPLHTIRRRQGTASPGQRVRMLSHVKKPPLNQFLHYRTSSLPGSYTSSSNSSIEHLNANHDGSENISNGQSSATSEGNHSSDEFSSSPMSDRQILLHHILANDLFPLRSVTPPPHGSTPLIYDHSRFYNGHIQEIPPPPSCPPPLTRGLPPHTSNSITTSTPAQHEYVNVQPDHSRSHSMDDNHSCGTASSSLSTSPHIAYLSGGTTSTVAGYIYSQSPSQSSSHSQSGDCLLYIPTTSPNGCDNEEYTAMGTAPSIYPHESASQPSTEYSLMSPTTTTLTSGYVAMRPQVHHSSPQDIINARRRSSSENIVAESYSPASPFSRSPDKLQTPRFPPATCAKCIKRDSASSFPCPHCSVITINVASRPSIPSDSCHGLKVDIKNDFSRDNNHGLVNNKAVSRPTTDFPPLSYSDEYACMDVLSHNSNGAHTKQSTSSNSNKVSAGQFEKQILTDTNEIYHQYLPMSPVNKSVVNAVLSVANSPQQYPHQITEHRSISSVSYSTNSLDRSSKHTARRQSSKSFAGMTRPRLSQRSKQKVKIQSGSESKSSATGDSSEMSGSPGGEYVSIDFDKARRQSSSPYVVSNSFSHNAIGCSSEQEISNGDESSFHSKRNIRKVDNTRSNHASNSTS